MCCNGFRIILMFALAGLSFVLNSFIPAIPVILWYLVSINIFTLLLFVIDKHYAAQEREIVPEFSLYFFSIAGGFVGAFLAMAITRHKIQERAFLIWQALISIIWIVAIYSVLSNLEAVQNALQNLSK